MNYQHKEIFPKGVFILSIFKKMVKTNLYLKTQIDNFWIPTKNFTCFIYHFGNMFHCSRFHQIFLLDKNPADEIITNKSDGFKAICQISIIMNPIL